MMRLVVVSPDSVLREAVALAISNELEIDLVADLVNRPSFPAELARLRPDVVLLHASPAKALLEACEAACKVAHQARVVAWGAPEQAADALPLIEAGVVGILHRAATVPMILETLAAIQEVGIACPPCVVAQAFARLAAMRREARAHDRSEITKLTPRELQVISVLASGLSNKEIAQHLCIEPQTVKNHIHNILYKLKLRNRVEAAQYAMERNMILPNFYSAEEAHGR